MVDKNPSYSSDSNKRDLWTVFGLDKKIQLKDTFFIMLIVSLNEKSGRNLNLMKKSQTLKTEYGARSH